MRSISRKLTKRAAIADRCHLQAIAEVACEFIADYVVPHVLSRLKDIGVKDIFGVAGDFAFPIHDAICSDRGLRFVGSCNELNAAYAADGYARIHGIAAVSTTYGVGELSAINGIAGSYVEHLPVFQLVGMPASGVQAAHRLVHHTLGNGEFDLFYKMAEPVVCAQAIMTPDNCVAETERLIAAALYHRRPVYLAFPGDYTNMPVIGKADQVAEPTTNADALDAAVKAVVAAVSASKVACTLPGIIVSRSAACRHLRITSKDEEQADFLAVCLAKADPKLLHDLHVVQSGIALPEHIELFEKGTLAQRRLPETRLPF